MKYCCFFLCVIVFCASCSKDRLVDAVGGCMDEVADNYNPAATVNDGSCAYFGCTDSLAINFDLSAETDDGSCVYDGLIGCVDSLAANYDSLALGCGEPPNPEDLSCCVYDVFGCTDSFSPNYNPLATVDDGSCLISFSGHLMPVFDARCNSCHGIGTPYPVQLDPVSTAYDELVFGFSLDGSAYVNTDVPEESYLYKLISGDLKTLIMPPTGAPLSNEEVNNVLKWIQQGAENN